MDQRPDQAPELGPAVDIPRGVDAVDGQKTPTADDGERTMQTPDELGGTGGGQAGGAG